MSITNQLGNYSSYKYVVTGSEPGPFHTIQSAIDYIHAQGGSTTILVRPGTYTESLTLYSGINIKGAEDGQVIMYGTHTPPASGSITISNCTLQADTDILSSSAAGTADITISNCIFNILNGYVFNVASWTGDLTIEFCTDISSANSIINNTGNSAVTITDCKIGANNTRAMAISGVTAIAYSKIYCPIAISGNFFFYNSYFNSGSASTAPICITISGSATQMTIAECNIDCSDAIAINATTSGTLRIFDTIVNTSATNVITGSSTGVEISGLNCMNGSGITGITRGTDPQLRCNILEALTSVIIEKGDLTVTDGELNINGTAGSDGQVVIGSTATTPQWASITSTGGTITITPGSRTLNLEVASGGSYWQSVIVDTAITPNNGYINNKAASTLVLTLPVTAALGTIVEVCGVAANGWKIAQNASQNIRMLNGGVTTTGATGYLASTSAYDTVKLVCTVANTTWNVLYTGGNLSIN